MRKNKISVSILAANLTELKKEIHLLNELNIDSIHLDIMDGNFVPNISFGKDVVAGIKKHTKKPLKTHLMINNPEQHISDFIKAGSDTIIFHYESTLNHYRLIEEIKQHNVKVGIALNPSTPEEAVKYLVNKLDEVLIMTVEPGFCKQKFLNSQLEKLIAIVGYCKNNNSIDIGVDGGLNHQTTTLCYQSGANLFAVGSYIFKEHDPKKKVNSLRQIFLP